MSIASLTPVTPAAVVGRMPSEEIAWLKARIKLLEDVVLDFMSEAETNAPNGTTKKWLRIFAERLGL